MVTEFGAKLSDYAVASNGFMVVRFSATKTFLLDRFFCRIDDVLLPFRID